MLKIMLRLQMKLNVQDAAQKILKAVRWFTTAELARVLSVLRQVTILTAQIQVF